MARKRCSPAPTPGRTGFARASVCGADRARLPRRPR